MQGGCQGVDLMGTMVIPQIGRLTVKCKRETREH